jgi:hypothetical protein
MPTSMLMIAICKKLFYIFNIKHDGIAVDIFIAYVSGALQYGAIGYFIGWILFSNVFKDKDAQK